MKKIVFLTIISVIFLISADSLKADQPYNFGNKIYSYITVGDGLPGDFIDDIYKDSHGFMWITVYGGGLMRYDGYDFKCYDIYSNSTPLKSNYIKKVVQDNYNRLWVASEGGIDIIDLKTGLQSMISFSGSEYINVLNSSCQMLFKDSHGNIFTNSGNSVWKISFSGDGNVKSVSKADNVPQTRFSINAFCETDNMILCAVNNIVYNIVEDNAGHITLRKVSSTLQLNCNNVLMMLKSGSFLWIGTDSGLYKYNFLQDSVTAFYHSETDEHSLSQNYITFLAEDANGAIIAASLKGLNFFNKDKNNFTRLVQDDVENPHTINCNFINCLFVDNQTIWIGTEGGGLNIMSNPSLNVTNYMYNKKEPGSISCGAVNSIYIDKDNNVWAGCIEGGLNLLKNNDKVFSHFTTDHGLSHNSISTITKYKDKLILGTWGQGITVFNPQTYKTEGFINSKGCGYNIDFVGVTVYDSINNGLWIGCTGGIFFHDFATGKTSSPLPKSMVGNVAGCLGSLIDKFGNLWIGSTPGVFVIDLYSFMKNRTNLKCKLLKPDPENRQTAFLNKTTCFIQTRDNLIRIGTDGYGLVTVYQTSDIFSYEILNSSDGLSNNSVRQLLEDAYGKIYTATANGLCCFSPQTKRFVNFYTQDGLCCNKFFWNGFCKSPADSSLWFGNIAGLVKINVDNTYIADTLSRTTLTKLTVDDRVIDPTDIDYIIDSDISNCRIIKLHEKIKNFSIEFSSLDFNSASSVEYRYRLKGYDNKWTYVSSSRRFASFTGLPAGEYVFQVCCTDGKGEFSNNITETKIIIKPYFYKTAWFVLPFISLIIFLIVKGLRWRFTILQRQKQVLLETVENRTADLQRKTKELAMRNEILSRQNKKITHQKTQLIAMAKKVKELTVDKLAFFTNITHEFRTPVTLIIGPIERALKLSTNPQVIEQLNFVDRNSKHLLSLINQLMDFRKVESGRMQISAVEGNIISFIDDMIFPFRAFAKDKNITINTFFRLSDPFIVFDREAMTKIIVNLLSNAMKFTPENGKVSLFLTAINNPSRLYISVQDNGQGLVKEDIEKIFNRFYQSENKNESNHLAQSGTGIGLYLCKRMAKLLGGDITALNNHAGGASFRLIIPIQRPQTKEVVEKIPVERMVDSFIEPSESPVSDKSTILVVEDNDDMRQYVKSILTDDYYVETASGGKEALDMLKNKPIDFIISDLMMPGMDGIALARAVRSDFAISHLPFLMLTAKTAEEAQLNSFKSGVDDFILKPFDEIMLKARISSILENRRLYHQRFKMNMQIEDLHVSEESGDKKFIDKAVKLVKENYKNSYYEVSDFVEAMGISKSLLNKKMQTLIGQSAGQFIRNYRLNLAREIILKNRYTHNLNISEIAYEVGFNDPKYFTRCFSKHFNVTPSNMMGKDQQ